MTKYKCWWPGCEYCTNTRSKIDFHHITPKEINPHISNKTTIPLCKTHHALIYHPDAKAGQHAIESEESLIIMGMYESTQGKTIHYKSMDGNEMYYFTRTGEVLI